MRLPVISQACATCTRRQLLKGIGVGVATSLVAACTGPGGGDAVDAMPPAPDATASTCGTNEFCIDTSQSQYAALATTDGSAFVSTPAGKLIVVRTSATAAVALSSRCTHAGCQVGYVASKHFLLCPCHSAEFSLQGSVLQGPTSTPLATYPATVSGTIITIALA